MANAQYQYTPSTYGGGQTLDQLKKLYGSNPSLVTTQANGVSTPMPMTGLKGVKDDPAYTNSEDYYSKYKEYGGYGNTGGYMTDTERANAEQEGAYGGANSLPSSTKQMYSDAYGNPYSLSPGGTKEYTAAGKLTPDVSQPAEMSDEEAYGKAYERINPVYDSLRSKAETDFVENRELIPQMMAARYGMSGTRGGRITSSYQDLTQKEAGTIQDIEGRRQGAAAEMAQAIKNQDWQKAMDLYTTANQLAIQKQQLSLQSQAQQSDDWARRAQVYMQMMGYSSDEAQRQLENNPLYWKNQMDIQSNDTDLGYKRASTQALLNEQDPEFWKNQIYQDQSKAELANIYSTINKRSAAGGSAAGGGRSGGGMPYNTALIRATELAKADPRLSDEYNSPDGSNYFSLNQLVDAYMTQIAYDYDKR